jgi:hypothetical protein
MGNCSFTITITSYYKRRIEFRYHHAFVDTYNAHAEQIVIFNFLCSVLCIIVCPFCCFSFGHCAVCPSSIYGVWLYYVTPCTPCFHVNVNVCCFSILFLPCQKHSRVSVTVRSGSVASLMSRTPSIYCSFPVCYIIVFLLLYFLIANCLWFSTTDDGLQRHVQYNHKLLQTTFRWLSKQSTLCDNTHYL